MLRADIEAGLTLCRSAGWNQLWQDWNLFFELDPNGNRVATDEFDKVVGTVATINYQNLFAWIGMVLVHPSYKRQGIGTRLLEDALHVLEDVETVKLDATPAGREVYLKLGFHDEYTLCRMVADRVDIAAKAAATEISEMQFHEIAELDKAVFGANRGVLLRKLRDYYPQYAFAMMTGKVVSSYCFGRKGYNFTQVGPIVASNTDEAIQISTAALSTIDGPMVMDVMWDSPFYHWLVSVGFSEQRKLIRMYKGPNNYPGLPGRQFAILGPEFG